MEREDLAIYCLLEVPGLSQKSLLVKRGVPSLGIPGHVHGKARRLG